MLSKCFSRNDGGGGGIKTRADAGLDLKISTLDMEARKWRKKFDVSVASFRFHPNFWPCASRIWISPSLAFSV